MFHSPRSNPVLRGFSMSMPQPPENTTENGLSKITNFFYFGGWLWKPEVILNFMREVPVSPFCMSNGDTGIFYIFCFDRQINIIIIQNWGKVPSNNQVSSPTFQAGNAGFESRWDHCGCRMSGLVRKLSWKQLALWACRFKSCVRRL